MRGTAPHAAELAFYLRGCGARSRRRPQESAIHHHRTAKPSRERLPLVHPRALPAVVVSDRRSPSAMFDFPFECWGCITHDARHHAHVCRRLISDEVSCVASSPTRGAPETHPARYRPTPSGRAPPLFQDQGRVARRALRAPRGPRLLLRSLAAAHPARGGGVVAWDGRGVQTFRTGARRRSRARPVARGARGAPSRHPSPSVRCPAVGSGAALRARARAASHMYMQFARSRAAFIAESRATR